MIRTPILTLLIALVACGGNGAGGAGATGGTGGSGGTGGNVTGPAYEVASWISLGGPPGGLGYDIRMHPDNPDVMFVTDDGAGVFKSTDAGQSWQPKNQGISIRSGLAGDGYPIFCLTIDPNDPDRIWIGTKGSAGIFLSTDGGESWTLKNSGIQEDGAVLRGFTVVPGNSNTVFAMGEIPSVEWNGSPLGVGNIDATKGFVYRTTDGGENWTKLWEGNHLTRYMWIDPQNHDRLFVSTGIFDRVAADFDIPGNDPGGVGVIRSLDGGTTWEELGVTNGFHPDDLYIGSLFMHPEDPNVLLAGAGDDPLQTELGRLMGGVYRTTDGGDTWIQVVDTSQVSSVEICEGDPDVWYATGVTGIFYSDDGGDSWQERASDLWGPAGVIAGFPIDAQCDPRDSDRLFINNYNGGNFLTTDAGKSWTTASTGYSGARIADLALSPDGRLYATARNGVWGYDFATQQWAGYAYGPAHSMEGMGLGVDPETRRLVLMLEDAGPEPMYSDDGGLSWTGWVTGLISGAPGSRAVEVTHHPRQPGTMFVHLTEYGCFKGANPAACEDNAGGGLIVTRDGGQTWEATTMTSGHVLSMAFGTEEAIYASVYGSGVFRSVDLGATWELANAEPVPPADGVGFWGRLVGDPHVNGRVVLGMYKGGTAVSEDYGETWTVTSQGMEPEATVAHLVADSERPGVMYAASPSAGVFWSDDGGNSWNAHNAKLSNRSVYRLALSPSGATLWAGLEGAGVFQLGSGN